MIVECIGNRPAHLSESQQECVRKSANLDLFPLTIGMKYTVYGVVFRAGAPWYLVMEEKDSDYPTPHFAGFFKILDNQIPVDWCFKWGTGPWPEGSFFPVKWSAPNFFERLLDGDHQAVRTFREDIHMLG